jgi:diaminopimelate epimerase
LKLNFVKYSATGNDFIVFDGRENPNLLKQEVSFWMRLCHRQNGIGADGVLILLPSESHAFKMKYMNADGNEVAMCGNGARAICHFAHFSLAVPFNKTNGYKFETLNGIYEADIAGKDVCLRMTELYDEQKVKTSDLINDIAKKSFYINTGVPHAIFLVNDADSLDVNEISPSIRYDKRFEKGVNVNYLEPRSGNEFTLRTFERGVEAETLACGTGAVASAIFAAKVLGLKKQGVFHQPGGKLIVDFNEDFSYVTLSGEARKVFEGTVEC